MWESIWDFFGKMQFRTGTNNNWRWVILILFIVLLTLLAIVLFQYALMQPETNYERAAQEAYRFGSVEYGNRGYFDGFFQGFSWIVIGLIGVLIPAAIIYTFFAFGDEIKRSLHSVRTRMWSHYGGELRDHRGFFTRIFMGHNPPPGVKVPPATGGATTAQTPAPAPTGTGLPFSRSSFIIWDALIAFALDFIAIKIWGKRR